MVMSLVSQFVDVLSGIVLHALICPFNASERDLAITHVNYFISSRKNISCLSNSILLFDRGYPSVLLFSKLIYNNIHFLMRCNTAFLKEINDFVNSGKKDGIVKINLKKRSKADRDQILAECPGLDLNSKITIRVIIVVLNTGAIEIFLTSLLDKKKYFYGKFKQFYFLRWGIETKYGIEKVRAEIENFSGKSQIAVEQDFHAALLNINMTTILSLEAKKELDKEPNIKKRKYEYDINNSIA